LCRFEKSKVSFLQISSMGGKNWFEISEVSKNRGSKKLRLKLQYLTGTNPRETCHGSKNREVRKIEGLKNRDSTVVQIYLT